MPGSDKENQGLNEHSREDDGTEDELSGAPQLSRNTPRNSVVGRSSPAESGTTPHAKVRSHDRVGRNQNLTICCYSCDIWPQSYESNQHHGDVLLKHHMFKGMSRPSLLVDYVHLVSTSLYSYRLQTEAILQPYMCSEHFSSDGQPQVGTDVKAGVCNARHLEMH